MSNNGNGHRKYSLADIEQYLAGKLSPADMHELEKAALQDPFLADAIEGYSGSDLPTAHSHLSEIKQQLMPGKQEETKIIPVHFKHTRWWQIAAALFLLAGTGTLSWFLLTTHTHRQDLAQQKVLPAMPAKDSTETKKQAETVVGRPRKRIIHKAMPVKQSGKYNYLAGKTKPVTDSNTTVAKYIIKGTVVDMKQNPIPFASVLAGNNKGTATDKDGNFTLKLNDSLSKVSVSAIGFAANTTPVSAAKDNIVSLKEYISPPSEVVVVGYTTAKKMSIMGAVIQADTLLPEGGWKQFNDYLNKKLYNQADQNSKAHTLQNKIEAEVELDDTGKVQNVTILQSFNETLSEQIAAAIKEGPKWIVPGRKKEKYKLVIKL